MSNQDNSMKVLFTLAYPLIGTGSGTATKTVMHSMKDAGFKVAVLCADNKTDYPKEPDIEYVTVPFTAPVNPEIIPGQVKNNYIMFTSHPAGATHNYWNASLDEVVEYVNNFKKYLHEEVKSFNPDVIHAQHNWLLSSEVARTGKPMVLTIHGTDLMGYTKSQEVFKDLESSIKDYPLDAVKRMCQEIASRSDSLEEMSRKLNELEKATPEGNREIINLYKDYCKNRFYIQESENSAKNADQIIVISEAQKAEFARLFPYASDKVSLLENGYDPKVFYVDESYNAADIFSQLHSNLTEDGTIPTDYDDLVLFVGKFADFKGLDSLLIANKLYDKKLIEQGKKPLTIIVGNGDLDDKLKQEAKDLGLQNTHFVGRQGHDIVRPLQNLATVSLIPSRDEPFGLVVIEGTACGHPVIGSNSGGIPDILNTDKRELPEDDIIRTRLGLLIKPLPKGPEGLTKEQTENLNSIAYTYIDGDEAQRKLVLEGLTKRLNVSEESLLKYFDEYELATDALANGVVRIVNREYGFDNHDIAEYTEDHFSQEIITGRTKKLYEKAIEVRGSKNALSRDE